MGSISIGIVRVRTTVERVVAIEDAGMQIVRWGLIVVPAWIDGMKLTAYETMGIQPLVAHSPLVGWMYILSVRPFSAVLGCMNSSLYAATKGAVDTLTMALAKELGPRNFRVNMVAPGLVDTEGNRDSGFVGSEAGNAGTSATPLGARFGKPEEIAPVIVFLASEDAGWLTGERINASGGLH
jgi:3-oxoacyl-[acyl-carrier protein] reductase